MKRKMLQIALSRATLALGLAATAATALWIAGTPALAGKPWDQSTTSGALHNAGDEVRAAGTFTERSYWTWDGRNDPIYFLYLTVSCTKLTPGASYVWYAATSADEGQVSFVAKRNGASGLLEMGFSRSL